MGLVTKGFTPTTNDIPSAAQWNAIVDPIYTEIAGKLDEANVDYTNTDGIVTMAQTQTISGLKTFSANIVVGNGAGLNIGDGTQQVISTGDGSTNLTPEFQVLGTAMADATQLIGAWSTTATRVAAPTFALLKSGNATIGSHTIVTDDEILGSIIAYADDGTDYESAAAAIEFAVDGTPGTGDMPGRIVFYTTIDGGEVLTEALRLDAVQKATFAGAVQVAGISTFGGNILSDTDGTDDIGTTGVRWKELFVDDITVTTTVTAGTSVIGDTMTVAGGSLTDSSGAISFGNENLSTTGTLASGVLTVTGAILPNANDGGALGVSGTAWADLFLASGSVLNFHAGDVTLTHSANTLTVAGGTFATAALTASSTTTFTGVTTHGGDVVSDTDGEDDLGTTSVRWGNVFTDNLEVTTRIGLGTSTFTDITAGLAIQQGAADDTIFALKSSDVVGNSGGSTWGFTTDEEDTYYSARKLDSAHGGLLERIYMEDVDRRAYQIQVYGGQGKTEKATTARSQVEYYISDHDGAGAQSAMTANTNLFSVRAFDSSGASASKLIVAEDGDLHVDGQATTQTFDEFEDAKMARALDMVRSPSSIIKSKWDEFVNYDRQALVDAGIYGEVSEEDLANGVRPLQNLSQTVRMHNGSIWQLYTQILDMCEKLEDNIPTLRGKLLPEAS